MKKPPEITKGFILGILVTMLVSTFIIPAVAVSLDLLVDSINIQLNGTQVAAVGQTIKLDSGVEVPFSIVYEGTTYLPMRKLAEILGMNVAWDSSSNTALISDEPISATIPEPAPTPESVKFKQDLSSAEKIQKYVQDNYGTITTPAGTIKPTIQVFKNTSRGSAEDYSINLEIEHEMLINVDSLQFTDADRTAVADALKNNMEALAKDLIWQCPDKKFIGEYCWMGYKYPTLKLEMVSESYFSWNNMRYGDGREASYRVEIPSAGKGPYDYPSITDYMDAKAEEANNLYSYIFVGDFHWTSAGRSYEFPWMNAK